MLFKILHGDDAYISLDIVPFHEGYCYVTYGGNMYVDMNTGTTSEPNNQRIQLNAANAQTLCGMTLEEIKESILNDSLKEDRVSEIIEDALADIPAGDAIIDVESLPTENINENTIYRVNDIEAHLIFNELIDIINGLPAYINVIDTLPETGEPAIDNPDSPTKCIGYYQISDNECYCWVPSGLGVEPNRWVPLSDFFSLMNIPYGGIVISTENVQENTAYVLLEYKPNLYHYKDGWHKIGQNEENENLKSISFTMSNWNTDGDFIFSIEETEHFLIDIWGRMATSPFKITEPTFLVYEPMDGVVIRGKFNATTITLGSVAFTCYTTMGLIIFTIPRERSSLKNATLRIGDYKASEDMVYWKDGEFILQWE